MFPCYPPRENPPGNIPYYHKNLYILWVEKKKKKCRLAIYPASLILPYSLLAQIFCVIGINSYTIYLYTLWVEKNYALYIYLVCACLLVLYIMLVEISLAKLHIYYYYYYIHTIISTYYHHGIIDTFPTDKNIAFSPKNFLSL